MADTSAKKVKRSRVSLWLQKFKAADRGDKKRLVTDLLFNNAMYIIIAISVIFIAVKVPAFLSISSIVNIISLTAAKLPIALGMHSADRYRYFRRPLRRTHGLCRRFSAPDERLCEQDVQGP